MTLDYPQILGKQTGDLSGKMGITIDIHSNAMHIDNNKLLDIYQECVKMSHINFLQKSAFQDMC